jgi:hypothetical protein
MKTIPDVNLLPWRVLEERKKIRFLLVSMLSIGLIFFAGTFALNRYFSNSIESLTKENRDLSAKISTNNQHAESAGESEVSAKRIQAFIGLIRQAKAIEIRLSTATADFGLSNSLHFSGEADTSTLAEWREKSSSLLPGTKLQVTELRKNEPLSNFEAQVVWSEESPS